jgi:hypothetical protein
MNYGPLIFLAAFFALSGSWFGFVLKPQLQVGQLQQTNTVPDGVLYPLARPGLAKEGLDVYRANGCASCHSQQVGQTGTMAEVRLTEIGTNREALIKAIAGVKTSFSDKDLDTNSLPLTVLQGDDKQKSDALAKALGTVGAKAEVWIVPVGPDIARGWGNRRSVAEDFIFDSPVLLGSQRIGPDLANVGARLPDANWHLLHLYNPKIVPGSPMPPYRFLFEKHRIERAPTPDALVLTGDLAPEKGFEIVPRPAARALVAYLTSLHANQPLFVSPVTVPPPPPPATNAPVGGETNAPTK